MTMMSLYDVSDLWRMIHVLVSMLVMREFVCLFLDTPLLGKYAVEDDNFVDL